MLDIKVRLDLPSCVWKDTECLKVAFIWSPCLFPLVFLEDSPSWRSPILMPRCYLIVPEFFFYFDWHSIFRHPMYEPCVIPCVDFYVCVPCLVPYVNSSEVSYIFFPLTFGNNFEFCWYLSQVVYWIDWHQSQIFSGSWIKFYQIESWKMSRFLHLVCWTSVSALETSSSLLSTCPTLHRIGSEVLQFMNVHCVFLPSCFCSWHPQCLECLSSNMYPSLEIWPNCIFSMTFFAYDPILRWLLIPSIFIIFNLFYA